MNHYFVSFIAGVFVGLIYSLLSVRSPAPPTIALVGLLGMLAGENIFPAAMHLLEKQIARRHAAEAVARYHAHESANTTRPRREPSESDISSDSR
jgi:XapX domain-containing protein